MANTAKLLPEPPPGPPIDWMAVYMGAAIDPGPSRRPELYADWDEDRTKFQKQLYLRAASWRPESVFPAAPRAGTYGAAVKKRAWLASPDGRMGYLHLRLPYGTGLETAQGARRGWVHFDGPIDIPALYALKEDGSYDHTWMGYTPNEILTQRRGVQLATGTVVVGGLGLGWLLRKVCAKKSVKRVILVEKSRALLDWYGHAMCAALPKVTDVVCDDVKNHYGKYGADARHLVDIWETYGSAPDAAEIAARRDGLKVWCWGEYAG